MEKLITIGKLSELSGLSKHTLRYYEEQSLIEAEKRTESNYRLFNSAESLRRIDFIKKAQKVNFSLDEIKKLLQIEPPNHPCEMVRTLLDSKIDEINKKIHEFENIKSLLVFVKGKWSNMSNCAENKDYSICRLIESI